MSASELNLLCSHTHIASGKLHCGRKTKEKMASDILVSLSIKLWLDKVLEEFQGPPPQPPVYTLEIHH